MDKLPLAIWMVGFWFAVSADMYITYLVHGKRMKESIGYWVLWVVGIIILWPSV